MIYIYYHPKCNNEDIATYIGFSKRQARYYVDACIYLNLVTDANEPTPISKDIIKNNTINITKCVYEQIILDDLIGQVFAKAYVFPDSDLDNFAQTIISINYPEILSKTTIERRAHNMVLWCKKIIKDLSI